MISESVNHNDRLLKYDTYLKKGVEPIFYLPYDLRLFSRIANVRALLLSLVLKKV